MLTSLGVEYQSDSSDCAEAEATAINGVSASASRTIALAEHLHKRVMVTLSHNAAPFATATGLIPRGENKRRAEGVDSTPSGVHILPPMPSTLREELHQTKPFHSIQQEALLSIVRTSAQLMDRFELFLRPYGITGTQYNVLRILRGSEPRGLCRNELRDRMLTRMPDVTRLLDRMEEADLVERTRDTEDRRMVTTRITPRALELLATLDPIVAENEKHFFDGISGAQTQNLIEVLDAIRNSRISAR